MAPLLRIRIFERQQPVFEDDFDGPIELGRQSDTEEAVYAKRRGGSRWRVAITRLADDGVSRKHALLEPIAHGRIRVTNLSSKLAIQLPDGQLEAKHSCELALPVLLTFGFSKRTTVRVEGIDLASLELQALAEATPPPGFLAGMPSRIADLATPAARVEMEEIVRWLQGVMGLLQSAASSSDFFSQAAKALVDLVGLNTGRVLLVENGEWKTVAHTAAAGSSVESEWQPSQKVLQRVLQEKRTYWQIPGQQVMASVSLLGVKAVVAAPILNRQSEVIGALYGDRRQEARSAFAPPITRVHALLVDLLASGVAAGLARLEQEQAALAARVLFEQFFTPELSRQLAAQPDLLKGRDCEVTILFCDIRGFSRICERLGPGRTDEWIREVIDALSESVLEQRGVLVDYIGDEVMAMWGAPEVQPDHAQLACQAGLDMLNRLPKLNERWQATLQEPLALGIGVNTGMARVGNTGSQRKFKYGPLGNTVNLASRVQGATKYLKTSFLVTGATCTHLNAPFATRRLGRVAMVNIVEAVELHEVVPADFPDWADLKPSYEEALAEFESKHFRKAIRVLGNLLAQHANDGPALVLLSRAVNALIQEPGPFDPVWKMPGK